MIIYFYLNLKLKSRPMELLKNLHISNLLTEKNNNCLAEIKKKKKD